MIQVPFNAPHYYALSSELVDNKVPGLLYIGATVTILNQSTKTSTDHIILEDCTLSDPITTSSSSGGSGGSGSGSTVQDNIIMSFSYDSLFPKLLGTINTISNISAISLDITMPFDDISTTISIGDLNDPSKFMTSNDNDANSTNKYTVEPDFKYDIATDVYLFITGTNTQGEGTVSVYLD